MAGYSGKPLAVKLGINEGAVVRIIGGPPGFPEALAPLPPGVTFLPGDATGDANVIVFFVTARAELEAGHGALGRQLAPGGGLWIAWPKRASGVPTDLAEDVLREVILPSGLVDNKVCAIDETWSGLRFVRRRAQRA